MGSSWGLVVMGGWRGRQSSNGATERGEKGEEGEREYEGEEEDEVEG